MERIKVKKILLFSSLSLFLTHSYNTSCIHPLLLTSRAPQSFRYISQFILLSPPLNPASFIPACLMDDS